MVSYLDRNRPPDITGPPVPPDVYAYRNSSTPVALCISCAAKRRADGKRVELVGDGVPVDAKCEGCEGEVEYRQDNLL